MSPRRRSSPWPRRAWLAAVVVVVAAVLWITLRPDHFAPFPTGTNLRPLEHHGRALQALFRAPPNRDEILYYLVTDVLGNVLLFLPLGFVTAGALGQRSPSSPARRLGSIRRLAAAGGLGIALSAAIEGIQLLVPGRATDVDDVIFNGAGTVVGAALLLVGERVVRSRRPRRSGRG